MSSIRKMKTPSLALANKWLYNAVLKPPTCKLPVGLGANRTRTCGMHSCRDIAHSMYQHIYLHNAMQVFGTQISLLCLGLAAFAQRYNAWRITVTDCDTNLFSMWCCATSKCRNNVIYKIQNIYMYTFYSYV